MQSPDAIIPPPIPQAVRQTSVSKEELRSLIAQKMARQVEALRLYEPMPSQESIHSCQAMDRIVTGGNRGGKSLMGFAEDARAVTNSDPHGKFPSEGVCVILGYGWEHCGKVVYRMLFQKGAFKIIKDETTGKWRSYRPYDENDIKRYSETKPAPPLIPERFLKGGRKNAFAWFDKKKRQFTSVELTTGWTIYYFASEGDPEQAQGFPINLAHVDENIHDRRWIAELFSRLADRKGRFLWTTIPGDDRTGALSDLVDDCVKESTKPEPRIRKFDLPFLDNRHIGSDEKDLMMRRWGALGEDEIRRRAFGESPLGYLVYPTFSRKNHGYSRTLLKSGEVPPHWTRYMVVDPGHSVCATLFAAVPPPREGMMVLIYDELYIEQCSAPEWGKKLADKVGGQWFHTFIIDSHGGNLADLTTGSTWGQTLTTQLRKHRIHAQLTGYNFLPGSTDIEARMNAVRLALYGGDGPPVLRFLEDAVPSFERTMLRYHKKRDKKSRHITDRPEDRGDVHLAQCCEYLCAYNPQYHSPPERTRPPSPAVLEFRREQREEWSKHNSVSFT